MERASTPVRVDCVQQHPGSELFAARYVEMGFRLLTLGTEGSFVTAGVERVLEVAGGAATGGPASGSPYGDR